MFVNNYGNIYSDNREQEGKKTFNKIVINESYTYLYLLQ